MFKRPHTTKTSAPPKSSVGRKLRDQLLVNFPHLSPTQAKELLPEGFLVMKATSHLGEPVTIYLAADSGNPLFFRIGTSSATDQDDLLVPTCYAFDLVPDLLPILITAPQVVPNLVSGAALFSQGVSDQSLNKLPDGYSAGQLVSICASGSDQVVAVGTLAASKSELLADRKGRAVHTLHARGDFLWESGNGQVSEPVTSTAPASRSGRRKTDDTKHEDVAEGKVEQLSSSLADANIKDHQPNVDSSNPASAGPAAAELSPAEVDVILRNALLLAISTTLAKNSAAFPMSASSVYSSYILPYRPAGTPPKADIKASGYKKLATLFKQANKSGVLVTKEVKGELLVMSVNSEHPDVQAVQSYKTISRASAQAAAASANDTPSSTPADGSGNRSASSSTVIVKELFKPSSTVLPIFQAVEHTRPQQDLYLPHELKKLLLDYVTTHSLVHPRDQKYVTLDPVLESALLKKGEVAPEGVLSKDDAFKRLKDACQAYWSKQSSTLGDEADERVVKKGSPPVIRVAIKNVGKRQVTLVSGHEAWDLFSSEELAEEMKHRSASSTSVQPIAGSAKKGITPKVEIMCQGTHDALVTKLLVARGVPKAYIDVDLTKSKR